MTRFLLPVTPLWLAALLLLPPGAAAQKLPQRDLLVELRQVEDTTSTGYAVGTQRPGGVAPQLQRSLQQVRVRNGEKAVLQMRQAVPVQWVESAGVSRHGAGVSQAVTWMRAGQGLVVSPRWPGGKQPAVVDVALSSESLEANTGHNGGSGGDLPTQATREIATRVSAPLGTWVTIASTGAAPQPGVYGTATAREPLRLLQVRVSAP
jgi:hypothetical protein